jgi:hypothetical protein
MLYYIKKHPEKLWINRYLPGLVKGPRLPLGSLVAGSTGPAFYAGEVKPDPGQVDTYTAKIKDKMLLPVQPVEYTAAGTGDMVPVMQQGKCDIAGKEQKQAQRKLQPGEKRFWEEQQGCCQQLGCRQQVEQYSGYTGRKGLAAELQPEFRKADQFAERCINKQQHEQRGG